MIHSGQDKGQLEGLVQFPSNHEAREPVQNGHQVHPASYQTDVGDVNSPDVRGIERSPGAANRGKSCAQGPVCTYLGLERCPISPFRA